MGDEIGAVAVRLRGWRQARSSVVAARGDAARGAASQPRPRTPAPVRPRPTRSGTREGCCCCYQTYTA